MELLQEFDFGIKNLKGKEDVIVDALFRQFIANAILCIKSSLMHGGD